MSSPDVRLFLLALLAAHAHPAATSAQPHTGSIAYQVPPEPIAGALEAPAEPLVLLSPIRTQLAILGRPGLPSIAELAEPELGLAGTIINPRNNGPGRGLVYSTITFTNLATGSSVDVRLPEGARLSSARWSPDGRHLAFLLLTQEAVELWVAEAGTGGAKRLVRSVNAAFPEPHEWLGDSSGLMVRLVPARRGEPPTAPVVPRGPVVRESFGQAAPAQTIQNLLSNAHEEALFDHYFTSQIAFVAIEGGKPERIGEPGVIVRASPSPDGRFILQERIKRPYSYRLPATAFPNEVFVTDRHGRRIRTIASRSKPLVSLGEVPTGPRAVRWRADAPATLFWAERGDKGEHRDRLYLLDAPFTAPARLIADVPILFQNVLWGTPGLALVTGIATAARSEHRIRIDPSGRARPNLLQERPFSGGADAGRILQQRDGMLELSADSSALLVELPQGLAGLDVRTGRIERLWSESPSEELFEPLDGDGRRLLIWRESASAPPNLFLVNRGGASPTQLTAFGDPAPAYAGMQARRLVYQRSDGRALGGTLYLPAGYEPDRDGPLPTLVWAYPASVEGSSRRVSPQARPRGFIRPSGFSDLPLLLTGRGYAVFEADMPIFGSIDSPANDTHVPQLVADARAAVAKLVEVGVSERGRIAIGGHSYGAAMVANLLAHSDLFRAGIALSGAYNRTLTPFGFQATEDRSFWEAPDAYLDMSPFVQADKINEPILLVHGAADSNSGTLPMQSERLFAALTGLGGTARYVLLPFEDHHYRARESLMHLMWEIDRWLSTHLSEPATPAAAGR